MVTVIAFVLLFYVWSGNIFSLLFIEKFTKWSAYSIGFEWVGEQKINYFSMFN